MNPHRLGFRIEAFAELHGWSVMEIGNDVPLSEVAACPADGIQLRTLCTFVGEEGRTRLRLGCCPSCGHLAYLDRPSREWMNRYYREVWDTHDLDTRTSDRGRKMLAKLPPEKTVVALAKALAVDPHRPVCEIGCGWGASLQHLKLAGFSNLLGTEASAHRAAMVGSALGFPVLSAPFESEEAQQELEARQPFSIIFSNHVLEHTYHPDEVVRTAARVQKEGDYLIIAVPNQEGEPPMGVFMFLPHLHSFTDLSLRRLAARHGYVVADDSRVTPRQLVLVFRRTASINGADVADGDGVFERTVTRYTELLDLHRRHVGLRRLWWPKRGGPARQRLMLGQGTLEARRWARAVDKHGYQTPRSIAVRTLRRRVTSARESPFEIQCRGPVTLFFK